MGKGNSMKMVVAVFVLALVADGALAQSGSFVRDQAFAEMQRVSAQVDVIAANQEDLAAKIRGAESMKREIDGLRAEIAALKESISEMRRDMQSQRGEIVQDLSKKIASIQPPAPKTPPKATPKYSGPCYEYTVQGGDTLSLIAAAFGTTVRKIKDMNGMKNDNIWVGQKINVPKE